MIRFHSPFNMAGRTQSPLANKSGMWSSTCSEYQWSWGKMIWQVEEEPLWDHLLSERRWHSTLPVGYCCKGVKGRSSRFVNVLSTNTNSTMTRLPHHFRVILSSEHYSELHRRRNLQYLNVNVGYVNVKIGHEGIVLITMLTNLKKAWARFVVRMDVSNTSTCNYIYVEDVSLILFHFLLVGTWTFLMILHWVCVLGLLNPSLPLITFNMIKHF